MSNKLGAIVANTPYSAVKEAEFAISMVRDDEASKELWLSAAGALAGMDKDAIAIESSTLSPDCLHKYTLFSRIYDQPHEMI